MKGGEREVKPEMMDGLSRAVRLKKKKYTDALAQDTVTPFSILSGGGSEEEGGFLITHPAHQRRFLEDNMILLCFLVFFFWFPLSGLVFTSEMNIFLLY